MPYTKPNKTSTTPRPTAKRPTRAVDVAGPQNPAATLIEATGTWNFSARVWIAFDPPTSTSPTWIDITTFVKQEIPININHGRGDTLSDVSATTCSLTVDNTDGHFLAANKSGAWYGQIHKGNWLRVEVYPPSGVVSERFTGFITTLPDEFAGETQFGQITASDRFEKLQGAPAIISSIQSEVLKDPNLAGNVQGYWNLHEAQGALTFGDTSGQGARYLQATGLGTAAGIGMGASNADGPGFDGLRATTFNPVSTTQGTYLSGPITSPVGTWNYSTGAYTGLWPTLELWFQATTTGTTQVLASLADPTVSQFASTLYIDGATGYLSFALISIAQNNPWVSVFGPLAPKRVDDGNWHHVVWAPIATTNSGNFYNQVAGIVDGSQGFPTGGGFGAGSGTGNSAYTQLLIGGGYNPLTPGPLQLGASNIAEVAFYWANWSRHGQVPNVPDHYAAGFSGFLGESTDTRIARLARYAGMPIPLQTIATAVLNGGMSYTSQVYNPIQGPWTNLSTGAHVVGTQSVAGRKPLDAALEAAHTENMPLYMNRGGYLEMQPSTTRQNTSPAWTVDAHDLDPSTRVADDFAYTTNQMTITPNSQAAQTVIGASGSAGQLSQAKYDVKDGSQSTASVNPIEAQSLGLGIIQLRADPPPRLAPVAFEASTTALLPGYGLAWYDAVLATEISTPARVANAPAAVGGGNYDFLVEGWTETITSGQHLFQFNVSQAQGPTYQLDDVVLGHIDTDGSTLAGSTLTTTALSFQVATTNAGSPLWTTVGADFPVDINLGGEQITVTSITGSSSPQTFNASARSVNGVVASHNVGAAVSLWQPLALAY